MRDYLSELPQLPGVPHLHVNRPLFDFLVAAASLSSYYLRYIVMSRKQNILGAN